MSTDAAAMSVPAGPTTRRLRREAWGFAVGSAFFFAGALPWYADWVGAVGANLTFFIGSIFFTLAGFIQLSLSGRKAPHARMNGADRADWWAAAIQFVGTLLFNISTGAALAAAIACSRLLEFDDAAHLYTTDEPAADEAVLEFLTR